MEEDSKEGDSFGMNAYHLNVMRLPIGAVACYSFPDSLQTKCLSSIQ